MDNFERDLMRLLWGIVIFCLAAGCIIGGFTVWVWTR